MRRTRFLMFGGLIAVALAIALFGLVSASSTSTIDFEGLTEGSIVDSVSSGSGISGDAVVGSVGVFGFNPDLVIPNAAMIFDAECDGGCTGRDDDLNFPGHGNTLIITEDGDITDPDDGDVPGSYSTFDFSTWGPGVVTVDSIDVGDVESEEAGTNIELYSGGPGGTLLATVPIPVTGDNVIVTVAINQAGVDFMRVNINGSGTIDNIEITVEEELPAFARITGGGWRVTGSNGESVRSSQGFTLHCDILLSNNLQINWRDGGSNKWHIDKFVDAAFCYDDPTYTPEPPVAPADTYVGVDVGRLNNVDGAVACWIFEDHGEVAGDPDGPDQALIRVWNVGAGPAIGAFDLTGDDPCMVESNPPGGETVLFVPLSDVSGNLQFHFDQPHKNK